MLANLKSLGYAQMTQVQAASLPSILAGRDVIAQASTGSGKTVAFGIGVLHPLNPRFFGSQALILCPTRELADQVAGEMRRLARAGDNIKVLTLCGGQPIGPQIGSLEHGAQIVVGTPGRVLKHLVKGTLDVSGLNTLVLDEADRMLDMGFYDSISSIIAKTPKRRQTLLFSATYADGVTQLAGAFMRDPEQIKVDARPDNRPRIEQRFYEIEPTQREQMVRNAIAHFQPTSCVVFCVTKQQCQQLVEHLADQGLAAMALNGDLEQRDRDEVMIRFANHSLSVLVATDVAARGLDIDNLDLVINAELTRDPQTHVHRIGRTGRAGAEGLAVSLVAPREIRRAQAIEANQDSPISWHQVDSLTPGTTQLPPPPMVTLCIAAGRRDKLRPGDILGALTGSAGIAGSKVGKINITDYQAYVAIERDVAKKALRELGQGKIKGRSLRVRKL